jgi:hypothetical protein
LRFSFLQVAFGIRKREFIRHILRHVPIIGVFDQASQVGNGPGQELENGLYYDAI